MKIKIVKKKMMMEAAKGYKDLPEDTTFHLYVDPDIIEVVMYSSSTKMGVVRAKRKDCKVKGNPLFSISWSQAEAGWGPLLYDLIFESAWHWYHGYIASDRKMVSGYAKKVWDYYLNNRSDITRELMDIDDQTIEDYFPENIKNNYNWGKHYPPINHITPQKDDDCFQGVSLEYSADMGDWNKHPTYDRLRNVRKNWQKSTNWFQQSTAHAYAKKNTQNISDLYDHLRISINGNLAKEATPFTNSKRQYTNRLE